MEIDQGQSSASSETSSDRDIVSELLERPFTSRNLSEQKEILRMPRPTPKLVIKTRDRSIHESWYSTRYWLCGSERKKRLFCWPCLLFRPVSLQLGHLLGMLTCIVSRVTAKNMRKPSLTWRLTTSGKSLTGMRIRVLMLYYVFKCKARSS